MFKQIFRTAIKELFNGNIPEKLIKPATDMIKIMVEAEKRWTKYISNVNGDFLKDVESGIDKEHYNREDLLQILPGFSEEVIDEFIEGQANSVCSNLGLPLIYENKDIRTNPLKILLSNHLQYGREGVFEVQGVEYTRGVPTGF